MGTLGVMRRSRRATGRVGLSRVDSNSGSESNCEIEGRSCLGCFVCAKIRCFQNIGKRNRFGGIAHQGSVDDSEQGGRSSRGARSCFASVMYPVVVHQ